MERVCRLLLSAASPAAAAAEVPWLPLILTLVLGLAVLSGGHLIGSRLLRRWKEASIRASLAAEEAKEAEEAEKAEKMAAETAPEQAAGQGAGDSGPAAEQAGSAETGQDEP